MKILLISPPSEKPYNERTSYALGIAYIEATLEKRGHDVYLLDYFQKSFEMVEEEILDKIKKNKPDIVGISCLTLNRTSARLISKKIKEKYPEIIIIIGGVHPTALPEQVILNYDIDTIVLGEGDLTIIELVNALESDRDLSSVEGIVYKSNGAPKFTGMSSLIKDLDELPFPKHDSFKEKILREKWAYMITSRGCPFGCQFCNSSQFWGNRIRYRSAENIAEEVEMILKNFNYPNIMFHDDAFTLNKRRVYDFVTEIKKRNLKFDWICSTRADSLDSDLIKAIKSVGCKHVAVGVESGSEKILQSIGKRVSKGKIIKTFEMLHNEGISTGIFLMVGNPGETDATVDETIDLLKKLGKTDLGSPSICTIYPGTPLYELAKSKSIIDDDYWLTNRLSPYYTAEHSEQELIRMANKVALANLKKDGYTNLILKSSKLFFQNPIGSIKRIVRQFI